MKISYFCLLLFFLWVAFFHADLQAADSIQGSYCYTYGDDESLVEAREKCRMLAIREAIGNYRVYIESVSTVDNGVLTSDLISAIANGMVNNVKVAESTQVGNEICMTIGGTISPTQVRELTRNVIAKKKKTPPLLPSLRTDVKIITAKVVKGKIRVVYKIMTKIGVFRIHCDYYDIEGDLVNSKCALATETHRPNDVYYKEFPTPEFINASSFAIRLSDY